MDRQAAVLSAVVIVIGVFVLVVLPIGRGWQLAMLALVLVHVARVVVALRSGTQNVSSLETRARTVLRVTSSPR